MNVHIRHTGIIASGGQGRVRSGNKREGRNESKKVKKGGRGESGGL